MGIPEVVLSLPKVSQPNRVMKGNSLFQDNPMGRCPLTGGKRSRVQTPGKVVWCFSFNACVVRKAYNIQIYISTEKHNKPQLSRGNLSVVQAELNR